MWASQTGNVTALKRVAAEGRIAAAWFAIPPEPLTASFSLSDGEYYQISLYLLDYNGALRRMKVRVLDALTGTILDEQAGDNFGIGKFFRWKARGDLRFEVTCENTTPVLSGVFIDPLTGYADWLRYHFSERERSVLEVIGDGADPDNDQIANLVEYAIGTNPRRLSHVWHSKSDPQHNEIAFTVSLDRSATDVDVSVETSTDLRSWLATKDAGIPSEVRSTHAQQIVTYRAPATGSTPAFFRLKVQRQTF
jgi:hypothetical protein